RYIDLRLVLPLLPGVATYLFPPPGVERALPACDLAAQAAMYGLEGETIPSTAEALARARELAGREDMIFIGGSNFVVGEIIE
ncbi:MAG: bifunctional folylpolyglutamate synthase/dihydrofolate synthase, partial [Alistipes sp.]|nr:bifunctional folylpolyglutamate synthase/dihydrofolate synthase [Alistipes sp.]